MTWQPKRVYWKITFWLQLLFCRKKIIICKSTTLLLVERSCSWMVYITRKLCGDSQQLDKLQAVSSKALPHVLLSLNKPRDVSEGGRRLRLMSETRQNCILHHNDSKRPVCLFYLKPQCHFRFIVLLNNESLNKNILEMKMVSITSTSLWVQLWEWNSVENLFYIYIHTDQKTNLKRRLVRISLFWRRKKNPINVATHFDNMILVDPSMDV